MSSTLLEVTRASHVEVERLERLIVKDLQSEPTNSKDRLCKRQRVRSLIDTIATSTQKLINIYEDKDGAMKDDIAALGGQTAKGTNVFSAFYDGLREIRDYHKNHPAAHVIDTNSNEEYEEPTIEFSGEEAFGKYLDLHELYNQYINSKHGEPIEYTAYLDVFSQPEKIPHKLKSNIQYREYIGSLLEYLVYFFERAEPLQDLSRIFSKVATEFEQQWANGNVSAQIDLDLYGSVEELIELGPETLREGLAALGLKTGGTVQQRAERLFLTKDTPLEKLDKKHHKIDGSKEIALMEAKVWKLCELLEDTISATKDNVLRKQSQTYEEIEAEREEGETRAGVESDDEDQQIYNPLKLPMGWDGKPIQYWLYKLHGLGKEFKCEICGGHSYWGRRDYERHFKESRHQHGMRCLGIPNTKNFNEITSIEEARKLWETIQSLQGMNKWRPDLEEYEDKEGNVYNKKMFTDLQRQGLI